MNANNKTDGKLAGAILALAFAMLWVPVGQHAFLLDHWMKLGTFMAPFLLFMAFAFRDQNVGASKPDVRYMALFLLVAYIIHQFEEHWIDLYGNTYAFKPYVNNMLLSRLDAGDGTAPPLSDVGVFVINTSLVWLVAALAIWRAPTNVFPTLCMAAIVVVNAFSHLITALTEQTYNPGLLTSIIIFLPLGFIVYWRFLCFGAANWKDVLWSLIWGILGHIIMIAGMLLSGWLRIMPEYVYFAILIVWSILPSVWLKRVELVNG